MTQNEKKRVVKYCAIGLVSSILYAFFTPGADWLVKLADGFFFGGLLVAGIGGFQLSARLGMFDLFLYSHKKLRRYSAKNQDVEQTPDGESYWEYLDKKQKSNGYRLPLWIGVLHIFVALLLVIVH